MEITDGTERGRWATVTKLDNGYDPEPAPLILLPTGRTARLAWQFVRTVAEVVGVILVVVVTLALGRQPPAPPETSVTQAVALPPCTSPLTLSDGIVLVSSAPCQ